MLQISYGTVNGHYNLILELIQILYRMLVL